MVHQVLISYLLSRFDPWVGKTSWRRERLPAPECWPGELHGLYSPWGHKESDMTERLSLSLCIIVCICQSLSPNSSHPHPLLDINKFVFQVCVSISDLASSFIRHNCCWTGKGRQATVLLTKVRFKQQPTPWTLHEECGLGRHTYQPSPRACIGPQTHIREEIITQKGATSLPYFSLFL